jgi:hypothetical protein
MKRFIAILTLGAFLQACMRWGSKPLEPARFDGANPDREVRVTVGNGGVLVVKNPFISGDSLVWLREISDEPAAGDAPPRELRQGIPLAQIRKVEVREVDAAKTTLLVVGTVGLVALLVATANSLNDWGSSDGGGSTGGGGSCDYCYSCPLVYSWDGHGWKLDSGTFGGAIMHALARTDVDNLDYVRPEHGVMRLKLANEQRETDYVDALSVLAVDHDPGLTVAPDAAGRLHTIGALTPPVAARDFRGRDALAQVRAADGWNWESSPGGRAAMTVADLRDGLELAFPRPRGAATARLVVDANVTAWAALMMERFVAAHGRATQAWYDSLDRDPQAARKLGEGLARQAFLSAAVLMDERWQPQGLIWDAGPEISKRQVAVLDLRGAVGDTVRVRLESVPSFWLVDRVALDYAPERPIEITEVQAASALRMEGNDVRGLLGTADDLALKLEPGDSAQLSFVVPDAPAGKARTYLLRTHGWYRIHAPDGGEPDVALLSALQSDPLGISRAAVARLNGALDAMEVAGR